VTVVGRERLDELPIVEARIRPVAPPLAAIERPRITGRLADLTQGPVTTVVAPAGYGKTTVLGQWAAAEDRPVAWLTIDPVDNDPSVFVAYLAAALARVGRVDDILTDGRVIGTDRVLSFGVPRLLADVHRWNRPTVLVIDDVHRLTDRTCHDVLSAILYHLPPLIQVVLAGRALPALPVARLRAERRLMEIGVDELALDRREAGALMVAAGADMTEEDVDTLLERTEGWAAGMYLATLAHSRADSTEAWVHSVTGADQPIADYLRSELAHRLSAEDMEVVTRCAVLDDLTPGAVAAVGARADGWPRIQALAAGNLFIHAVGLDGQTYRYHKLLRDFLLTELVRRDPDSAAKGHRAAFEWYRSINSVDLAVGHALAAGDREAAAGLVSTAAIRASQTGEVAVVERWLSSFTIEDFQALPLLTVVGIWAHMLTGRGDEALRLWGIAERASTEGLSDADARLFESRRHVIRALFGPDGARAMLLDARFATEHEPATSRWHPDAVFLEGFAQFLLGELDDAEALLAAAAREGVARDSPNVGPLAMGAMIRLRRGDWLEGVALTRDAASRMRLFRCEHLISALPVYALEARIAARDGDVQRARDALVQAQLVRPLASRAFPAYAVAGLLELARAYLALSDPGGAQIVLREAEQLVRWTPSLGLLTDDLIQIRGYLSGAATALVGSSALTTAELRILPFLPTYLSFPEIADRLNISRNTVKTHAMSIYGKLWASSRGEAVERAVELGLLEPYPGLSLVAPPATTADD
jgi:LuxR family maltose regulon positive regulatory protein